MARKVRCGYKRVPRPMRAAGKAPQQLSAAIFEWIEAWYNPRRRHTSAGYLAPADYQRRHTTAATAT